MDLQTSSTFQPDSCPIILGADPLKDLKHDGAGICSLCRDGVFRSLTATGEVVDYRKLSPSQISAQLDAFASSPLYTDEVMANARKIFEGVDGRNVEEEKCWNPSAELIPELLLERRNKAQSDSGDEDDGEPRKTRSLSRSPEAEESGNPNTQP